MNIQIADILSELQEQNLLDQIRAISYVAVMEDGDTVMHHSDLDEEEMDATQLGICDLSAMIEPSLDS